MMRGLKRFSALVVSFIWSTSALATITPLQSIDFGTIAVTNNSFPSSVIIDPVGNVQIVGGIAVIDSGNHGVFELSDLPANQTITADVSILNTEMIGQIASEETFTFSVITNTNRLVTNSSGVAFLNVGGRIDTSGSGSIAFSDTAFESTIQITVNL